MIKRLLITLALLLPSYAQALHVVSPEAGIDIVTDKVAHLETEVNGVSLMKFQVEMFQTLGLKGDRVILIKSGGGNSADGQVMINILEAERAKGTRIVCVVERRAHSMAFNLLTHCDVRLASPDTLMIFHKIAIVFPCTGQYIGPRLTPKALRIAADEIEAEDEVYRHANAAALKMTLSEYDDHADKETVWHVSALLKRGYLHGIARLEK